MSMGVFRGGRPPNQINFWVYRWFAQSTIRANSQDDSRRMIRAAGDDSRNYMDVSRKQAAMLFLSN